MELSFFHKRNILEASRQFFSEILDINVAPAVNTEIKIQEFLKDQITDIKLLSKVTDARIIGMINNISINDSTAVADTYSVLKDPSDDYDMLIVFGIEIDKNVRLTKTDISRFTRALNRRSFNRPVAVLIHYGNLLSFSAAERGRYKNPGQSGEKVGRISILKDIDIDHVHAGHERILLQLQINPLKITSFNELYNQWIEVFNLKTLNNDFYKKVADWYFWATKIVKFPIDHYKTIQDNLNKTDEDLQVEANQIALIRFITRIIFVWFLKAKDSRIIPAEVFDYRELKKHLLFNDEYDSNYYKAILQNLFFASFNTKIDSPQRTFSDQKRTTFLENRYRYSSLFNNPEESVKKLFSNIPFLNGGLFSNLDYKESDKKTIRVDWFSDPAPGLPKNKLYFPDFLFFDEDHEEDLSDFYETKGKHRVKGLIPLLKEYYFTIEENTPLEQEIALDPELLGKIFENLLASYNPETRTTARKLTGSFYTPREIVNYMVDESLIAFLKTKLTQKLKGYQELGNQQTNIFGNEGKSQLSMQIDLIAGKWDKNGEELETKLRELFSYENEENPFQKDKETTNEIISHLSECKILDPACGSGAFPMGILHQIVHALKKLDSDNKQWKQVQYERLIAPEVAKITGDISTVQKLSSDETRKMAENQLQHELEELLGNFARHDHNYTRKLHLIENCIYGVDIQTVAIHISKLRFFISLLVDQNIDFRQRDKNYLLNSLPNLETKFVAANTLIPLNSGGQLKTREVHIIAIEEKIKAERKKYFDCKSREEKLKIEKKDEALRIEFADALKKLTEQGRNNLLLKIQALKAEIDTHCHYKAKAQTDRDKARISKGIDTLRKDLEKQTRQLEQYAGGDDVANKILHFNPYDANSSAPFFDPEIMFALQPEMQTGFFDIVIGNPPWGSDLTRYEKEIFKVIYPNIDSSTPNSYSYFIGLADKLHRCVFSYVLPDSILIKDYMKTRTLIKDKLSILHWYQNIGVPEKIRPFVYVDHDVCLVLCKSKSTTNLLVHNYSYEDKSDKLTCDVQILDKTVIIREEFENVFNIILKSQDLEILKKIVKHPIIDAYLECHEGIHTGNIRDFLFHNSKINESCKPLFYGGGAGDEIGSYFSRRSGGWYVDYRKDIINTEKGEYASLREQRIFSNEKVYITRTGKPFKAFYDESNYASNNFFSMQFKKIADNNTKNLKVISAFLNSKIAQYFVRTFAAPRIGNLFIETKILHLLKFHIPLIDEPSKEIIFKMVIKIIELKKQNNLADKYIRILDLIIFKLYSLTYNECQIVDPGIEELISLDDYENSSIEELAGY